MMDERKSELVAKVPQVTLLFWIIKILATTLGETGGDAVTMSMNLGYLVGTAIFAAIFAMATLFALMHGSLVSVDGVAKSFRYNHDYYLMKHLSHFVEVGAKRVETTGTCDDALGFVNPDGGLVFLLRNAAARGTENICWPARCSVHSD